MDTHLAVLRAQVAALRAELARTQLELGLWKSQLALAQKEILRAQQVVDEVDRARADAEERSHRYRQTLRRLLEERAVQLARDEGRRLGYREGFQFGTTSRPSRPSTSRAPPPPPLSKPPTAVPPAPPEQTRPHINHPTHDVPPDNYIPTLPEGDPAGLVLPPPHEWNSLPPDQSFAHSSSHAGPPSSGMSRRSRMTLPERIADEWRSQNPDVHENQDDAPIPRPMSSSSSGPPRPNTLNPETPPRRPTTTAPTPTHASPSSDVFRDGNHNPSGDWLKPRSHSVSYASTPNIAIQSPSMSPMSPFNNTETTAIDSGLLSPTQQYLQPTRKRPPVIPTPPTQQPQHLDTISTIPQIYIPGVMPLSPIPALSNLAAIPENTSSSSRSHHLSISMSKSAAPLSPSILTSKKAYYSTSSDSSTTSYPKSRLSSVPVPGASSSVHSRDW